MTVASQRLVGARRTCEAAPRNRGRIAFDVSVLFRYRERMKAHARRDPKPGARRVSDPARDLFGPGAKGAPGAADLPPASDAPAQAPRPPWRRSTRSPVRRPATTASDIEVLEGLEPVRRRPGMYIGGTDERALHHLFAEVIDNAMDEAVAGHASFIEVELEDDGCARRDRQWPRHPGRPAPEISRQVGARSHHDRRCTRAGSSTRKAYETSGGLHGVGVSVVNALSERLEVEVARGQTLYRQTFSRGHAAGPARDGRPASQNRRGTQVRFQPDAQIFGEGAPFKPARLFRMARSKAYLFGGVEIRWTLRAVAARRHRRVPAEAVFRFPDGLARLPRPARSRARSSSPTDLRRQDHQAGRPRLARMGGRLDGPARTASRPPTATPIPTPEGGTHESGLRVALLRGLRDHAERVGQAKRMAPVTADDVMATCAVHALGLHPRAGVPGPDQGQARHASRPRASSRTRCATPSTTGWPPPRSRPTSCSTA